MKSARVMMILFLVVIYPGIVSAIDLGGSNQKGSYPWDGIPVYEQVAVAKVPKADFDRQLFQMLSQTPFSGQMIVPLELRPLVVSMLVGAVLQRDERSRFSVITGDPNPIVQPILRAIYGVILGDDLRAGETASYLSSIPLMMPDSGGSAVLELKNSQFDPLLVDYGPERAFALPWKVGFWSDGDYVRVDILNPVAMVKLFFFDLPSSEYKKVLDMAEEIRRVMIEDVVLALSAIFPEDSLSIMFSGLPPFLRSVPNMPFATEIGRIPDRSDASSILSNPVTPQGDSLFEISNPMLSMKIDMEGQPMEVHPLLLGDYFAFDGMASFLSSAYTNPLNQAQWSAAPDGQVLDDFMFLAAKTYTKSPVYSKDELQFYRNILSNMFKMTFLRPRGNSLVEFTNSSGEKVWMADVGSPYYGQILLKLGAHRAPGTPCKLIAFYRDGEVKVMAYNTTFMFQAFFGDVDPRSVHQGEWDGAFDWPEGMTLEDLANEAEMLYSGYLALALKGLGGPEGSGVVLSPAAEAALVALTQDSKQ